MTITLRIPRAAWETMQAKSLADVQNGLHVGATLPIMDVLTFGYINTPITLNATGELCAYVVEWTHGQTTVCKVNGDSCTVIGMESVTGLDTTGALDLFHKYWRG